MRAQVTAIGAGLALGASLGLIIPEGFELMLEGTHDEGQTLGHGMGGLALTLGLLMFLVLENAELPDGETVATLWWCSTDGASDLTDIDSLKDPGKAQPRFIEKKLLLDFSTLPNNEGLGNFEGVDERDGRLYFVEDNEHGKAGSTRLLVLTKPSGLEK